jgi:hypothetical protein
VLLEKDSWFNYFLGDRAIAPPRMVETVEYELNPDFLILNILDELLCHRFFIVDSNQLLVIDIDRDRKFVRWRSLRFAESLLFRRLAYTENT